MSILKLFSGPSPEKLEQKGDALFEAALYGEARQVYDRAYDKLENQTEPDTEAKKRIADKFLKAGEALAREHRQTAENYLAGGHFDEARDMLALALEITSDPDFKAALKDQLHAIVSRKIPETNEELPDLSYSREAADDITTEETDDEYFYALCGPLPDEVQDAYLDYGEDFKVGYIALNRGDFQTAAAHLARALEQHPQPDSFIPLEMAAACLNLGELSRAQELLEGFLLHHPDALPGYRLLCEVYWEKKDFPRIDDLLASVPDALIESLAVALLKGENFLRAGKYKAARDFYQNILDTHDWNDSVAVELAKTYELLNEPDSARSLYGEMINRCKSCHARIDPVIKHKYAELCFAAGKTGTDILEMYLSLASEIPENAAQYFDRISRIYASRGNMEEAERFRSFSIRAQAEQD